MKKIWFYLCITQAIIIVIILFSFLWSLYTPIHVNKTNIEEYVLQFNENNNYLPTNGYIPDAKTAQIIGVKIINKLTNHTEFSFGSVNVEYDETNRLWKVQKTYLFGTPGAFVVFERDTGKIIKALLIKR